MHFFPSPKAGISLTTIFLTKSLCAEFLPPSATMHAHMQLSICVQGDKSVVSYGSHLRRLTPRLVWAAYPQARLKVTHRSVTVGPWTASW